MSLSIKVKEVYPLDNMILRVIFENGITKLYDVKQLLPEYKMFEPLINNKPLFNTVAVDCGGCGIAWNENIDISECELWEGGVLEQ